MRYGFWAFSRDFFDILSERKRLPAAGYAYAIYPIAQRGASHRSSPNA
jgi:hypothetical protein